MFTKNLMAAILGAALLTGLAVATASPAAAQSCLTATDARSVAQGGQVVSLSYFLGQIRAQSGGEIYPNPQLCIVGGQYVYLVTVNVRGIVKTLTVDARTGTILGGI